MQEAYDVLSDAKKREMYDQYGFYSDNGAGRRRAREPARSPTWISAVLIFPIISGRGARSAGGAGKAFPTGSAGGGFRDVFSQFFNRGASRPQAEPREGQPTWNMG